MINRADFGYLSDRAAAEMAGACARWQADRYGWVVDPAWIRPLPDVIMGLRAAITVFSEPGSQVILPTPAYMPFLSVPKSLGREIISVPMATADDGRAVLDLAGIDAAFKRGGQPAHPLQPLQPRGPGLRGGGTRRCRRRRRGQPRACLRRRGPRPAHLPGRRPHPLRVDQRAGCRAYRDRHLRLQGLEPPRPQVRAADPLQRQGRGAVVGGWLLVRARRVHPRRAGDRRRLPRRRSLAR